MTIEERNRLAEQPIIWKGDLSDDCTAKWAGLMLRAEWMDEDYWWWAVYDMQNDEVIIDSSNEYDAKFIGGNVSRAKAEAVARGYIKEINLLRKFPKDGRWFARFFTVYVLPVISVLTIFLLTHLVTSYYSLEKKDKVAGYIAGLITGMIFYFVNIVNWLPLGNGRYIHKKQLATKRETPGRVPSFLTNEPATYAIVFYRSLVLKIVNVICGLAVAVAGFYSFSKSSIIFPLLIIAVAAFLLYNGIKELLDTSPKLKLAKEGLWTKELGFTPWSSIKKTELKEDRSGRLVNKYLEIYIDSNDHPAQRLQVTNLKDHEKIEVLMEQLHIK